MASNKEITVSPNEKTIAVEQISPTALAAFFSQQTGQDFPQGNYYDVFTFLRKAPPREQENLLVSFFSGKVKGFPHGEELGKKLAEINNIPWFQPKQEPNPSVLGQLMHTYLERLNYPLQDRIQLTIRRDDWAKAETTAWRATGTFVQYGAGGKALTAAWQAAQSANLTAAWHEAEKEAGSMALYLKVHYAIQDAARVAQWIVVKDLMPARGYIKGNPFDPLMEIYKLGCWPIGPVSAAGSRIEFVIFVPPIAGSKTV